MKLSKVLIASAFVILSLLALSSCSSNPNVSTSVHYSMGVGYPMYYDPWHHNSGVVVVRPPVHRPINRPNPRPRPRRR